MLNDEMVDSEQSLVLPSAQQKRSVEIPNAFPVRLQTLDLARHATAAPDGKRYVVATFNDMRLNRGYVTAVYPQQNGYLTLIRLTIVEISSKTPEQAMQQHLALVQAVQKGRLGDFIKK